MDVHEAIQQAEAVLPGRPALEGEDDPRWQAIIAICEHIKTQPKVVWTFVERWACHTDDDLRDAVATCLLEHLLETDFDHFFPYVEKAARSNPMFADTLSRCWKYGQATTDANSGRIDRLLKETAK